MFQFITGVKCKTSTTIGSVLLEKLYFLVHKLLLVRAKDRMDFATAIGGLD